MMTNAWVIILCFFSVWHREQTRSSTLREAGEKERGGRHKGELKVREEACSRPGKSVPKEPKGLWAVFWNLPLLTLSGCERK